MDKSIAAATLIVTTLALAVAPRGRPASPPPSPRSTRPRARSPSRPRRAGQITLTAAQEVKNLEEVKVGDQVDVEYLEASALGFKALGETATATRDAPSAARPSGTEGRKMTVIGVVMAVDEATQTVTLRAPQRTVELRVSDPGSSSWPPRAARWKRPTSRRPRSR